jgi:hypothetical protein
MRLIRAGGSKRPHSDGSGYHRAPGGQEKSCKRDAIAVIIRHHGRDGQRSA